MWLANWPILRLMRSGAAAADRPTATVESAGGPGGRVRRIAALCPAAAALGLRVGQALAEARALCPELDLHDADPAGDQAGLARLASKYH